MVEAQDVTDAVADHGGNESTVVCLLARNLIGSDKIPPVVEDGSLVAAKGKKRDHSINFKIGSLRRQTQSIHFSWTRSNDPEFIDNLRDDTKLVPDRSQRMHSRSSDAAVGMAWLHGTQQQIGIQQNNHSPRPA
ncbi:hypothetical protein Pan181_24690 [Aeoliella mucimassa]|uniref:Uncharacterized protein n=1 Tax=Aeoliella mucimassa TaxID=2527972 RepID=A0A518ANI4_9BACT|nr:hypothetical protein Pan181_24690 [Aeoliella mucimassa]